VTLHSLLFPWQWRNYIHFGKFEFSDVAGSTLRSTGMYKSYERNQDLKSQGLPPLPYYLNASSRCLLSLLTRPVSLKYFGSKPLKAAGKIYSYPWIMFWLAGILLGLRGAGKDICYPFLAVVILYFIFTSVIAAMWIADARFRVPMMPFIAILSAYGWSSLKGRTNN
jgi:hypothetical protein